MIERVKNFNRKDLFLYYNKRTNPFFAITTKIDVTNVVNYCKKNGNFYATMGYLITKSVNKIDEFKYYYKNRKFYYCDCLGSSFTQLREDKKIDFFAIPFNENYDDYIKNYKVNYENFLNNKKFNDVIDTRDVWLSCSPWLKFESLMVPFDKKITNPQFIWDKYVLEDDKYYLNMMIMVHHGFVDGYHINLFLELLTENMQNLGNK